LYLTCTDVVNVCIVNDKQQQKVESEKGKEERERGRGKKRMRKENSEKRCV
jgi:hypothetical protein